MQHYALRAMMRSTMLFFFASICGALFADTAGPLQGESFGADLSPEDLDQSARIVADLQRLHLSDLANKFARNVRIDRDEAKRMLAADLTLHLEEWGDEPLNVPDPDAILRLIQRLEEPGVTMVRKVTVIHEPQRSAPAPLTLAQRVAADRAAEKEERRSRARKREDRS